MDIVLISSSTHMEGETALINNMFEQGLDIFHLRKPDFHDDKLAEIIEQIKPVFHSRVKLHSSFGLLDRYQLGGIHLSAEMSQKKEIIELKKSRNISISSSFHSYDEVIRRNEYIDYAFLSPVFDSISKKNYKSWFDYNELYRVLNLSNIKIIALGGCESGNIDKVKELGFSGAAFLGAVWGSSDPLRSFIEIKKAAAGLQAAHIG